MTNHKNIFLRFSLKTIFVIFLIVSAFLTVNFQFGLFQNKRVSSQLLPQQNLEYTQEYLDFLSLPEEVQQTYSVLPRMYDIDADSIYSSPSYSILGSSSLPSEFSLFYLSSISPQYYDGLQKNVGYQSGTNICWAYAVLTSLETSLYKSEIVEHSYPLNFSELNLAYVSQVENHNRNYIGGGTFDLAYEYLSSEYGPVFEGENESYCSSNATSWSSDQNATNYYRNNFLSSATLTEYRALEAFYYPSRSSCTSQQKIDLRNSIKSHIYNFGGVTSSIYFDYGNLFNKQTYLYTGSKAQNHMITLVGWDDDFTMPGMGCIGAYIAQNSYGTNFGMEGYFYIMYDDTNVEENVCGFVRVGEELEGSLTYNNLLGTEKENQFISFDGSSTSFFSYIISSDYYVSNIYKRQNVDSQFISRIKVPTTYINDLPEGYSSESHFYVYVLDGLSYSNVSTEKKITDNLASNFNSFIPIKNKYATGSDQYLFKSNQTTYYTVELDAPLNIEGEYFAVMVKFVSGTLFFSDNESPLITLPYQFTYKSTNKTNWSPYLYSNQEDVRCILPMVVQTKYYLGEIVYSCDDGFSGPYDGENHFISVNVTTPTQYNISFSLDGNNWQVNNFFFKNFGVYDVYFKITASFYETVIEHRQISISKRPLIILPETEQEKYYGTADPILSYTWSGNFEMPAFSGRLSRVSGDIVGSYQITQGTLSLINSAGFNANNYIFTFDSTPIFFEIVPRILYITPNYSSKTYGEIDPEEFSFNFSNGIDGQTPMYLGKLKRQGGTNVGKYDIINDDLILCDNDSFLASNYTFQIINNLKKFEILKRNLIVLPKSNQKIYLQQDPEFAFDFSNNLTGETPIFYGSLSREAGENVGNYAILLGTLSFDDNDLFLKDNYQIVLSAQTVYFIINYGTLTGFSVSDKTVNYNGTYFFITPVSDDFSEVTCYYSLDGFDTSNWSDTNFGFKNVGENKIYFKFCKQNYNPFFDEATLKINRTDLIVVPLENQSKVYGAEDPILDFIVTGNVLNEVPSFSGELNRDLGEDVEDYLIFQGNLDIIDGEDFLKTNYNLVFKNLENICFEIKTRPLIVIPAASQGKTYGESDSALTYYFQNNLAEEIPSFSGGLEREIGEDVGQYLISNKNLTLIDKNPFKASNYLLQMSDLDVYFIISKANITLTIDNQESFYNPYENEVITDFTLNITGDYIENDELNIEFICSVDQASKKGQYPLSCVASNNNYNIEIIDGLYTVKYYFYNVKFRVLNVVVTSSLVEHFSYTTDVPIVDENGYSFNGWEINYADGSHEEFVPSNYPILKETVIDANMSILKYTISYKNADGFEPTHKNPITIHDGMIPVSEPEKIGYTFSGWFDNKNFLGDRVFELDASTFGNSSLDIYFYAKWQINVYTVSFSLAPNDEYQIVSDDDFQKEFDSDFSFSVLLSTPYTQSQDTLKVFAKNQETNERHLLQKAHENYILQNISADTLIEVEDVLINVYEIKFLADKVVVEVVNKNHGQSFGESFPEIPVKEYFDQTPAYWDKTDIENITSDIIVSAVYVPNVYEVTFVMHDGREVKVNVSYGQEVSYEQLNQIYDLGVFEYFVFDTSLQGVSQDTIINVFIQSDIYILYIIIISILFVILITTFILILRKKRITKFNWWVYKK